MAISLNKLISVAPSVITAAGNAIDLNGLILSDNDYLPVGKVLSFAGPDTVRDKFGSSSDEFSAASIYFQGVKNVPLRHQNYYLHVSIVMIQKPSWSVII